MKDSLAVLLIRNDGINFTMYLWETLQNCIAALIQHIGWLLRRRFSDISLLL